MATMIEMNPMEEVKAKPDVAHIWPFENQSWLYLPFVPNPEQVATLLKWVEESKISTHD